MKKATAIYFIACTLTTSNYTYGMFRLLTKKPTNHCVTQYNNRTLSIAEKELYAHLNRKTDPNQRSLDILHQFKKHNKWLQLKIKKQNLIIKQLENIIDGKQPSNNKKINLLKFRCDELEDSIRHKHFESRLLQLIE